MKPNKENIITEILVELSKGTTYSDCFGVIRSNSELAESTFAIYWNEANRRHKITQSKVQDAIVEQSIELTNEAVKSGLKSKLERQLELQAMLEPDYMFEEVAGLSFGVAIWVERKLTPIEKQKIHAELSKMDGSYAPIKNADTDVDGNDKLSDDDKQQIRDLVATLNGKG